MRRIASILTFLAALVFAFSLVPQGVSAKMTFITMRMILHRWDLQPMQHQQSQILNQFQQASRDLPTTYEQLSCRSCSYSITTSSSTT